MKTYKYPFIIMKHDQKSQPVSKPEKIQTFNILQVWNIYLLRAHKFEFVY